MCFGNNPGCKCCQQLPFWDDNRRISYSTQVVSMVTWPGRLILRGRSYDVIYLWDNATKTLRQSRSDYPTINWEHVFHDFGASVAAAQSRGVLNNSTGDHGLLQVGLYEYGDTQLPAFWVRKDGTWQHTPKLVHATNSLNVSGVGILPLTGALPGAIEDWRLIVSPNSAHAILKYTVTSGAARFFRMVIGALTLQDNGDSYTIKLSRIYSYNHPFAIATTTVSQGDEDQRGDQIGVGHNGELYFNHRYLKKAPGAPTIYSSANDTVPFINQRYEMRCFPGNQITYYWFNWLEGGPDANKITWGTQTEDGNVFAATFDRPNPTLGYDPIIGGPVALPIAGRMALELSFLGKNSSKELAEEYLVEQIPTLAERPETLEELQPYWRNTPSGWGLLRDRFYFSNDWKRIFEREVYNYGLLNGLTLDFGIGRPQVLGADSTAHDTPFRVTITRLNPTERNTNATAVTFRAVFPDSPIRHDTLANEVIAGDFEILTTGTVTQIFPLNIIKINSTTWDFTATGIDGGDEGGRIALAVCQPTLLRRSNGIFLDAMPAESQHYDILPNLGA